MNMTKEKFSQALMMADHMRAGLTDIPGEHDTSFIKGMLFAAFLRDTPPDTELLMAQINQAGLTLAVSRSAMGAERRGELKPGQSFGDGKPLGETVALINLLGQIVAKGNDPVNARARQLQCDEMLKDILASIDTFSLDDLLAEDAGNTGQPAPAKPSQGGSLWG